jgi:hypothetical protein
VELGSFSHQSAPRCWARLQLGPERNKRSAGYWRGRRRLQEDLMGEKAGEMESSWSMGEVERDKEYKRVRIEGLGISEVDGRERKKRIESRVE